MVVRRKKERTEGREMSIYLYPPPPGGDLGGWEIDNRNIFLNA